MMIMVRYDIFSHTVYKWGYSFMVPLNEKKRHRTIQSQLHNCWPELTEYANGVGKMNTQNIHDSFNEIMCLEKFPQYKTLMTPTVIGPSSKSIRCFYSTSWYIQNMKSTLWKFKILEMYNIYRIFRILRTWLLLTSMTFDLCQ